MCTHTIWSKQHRSTPKCYSILVTTITLPQYEVSLKQCQVKLMLCLAVFFWNIMIICCDAGKSSVCLFFLNFISLITHQDTLRNVLSFNSQFLVLKKAAGVRFSSSKYILTYLCNCYMTTVCSQEQASISGALAIFRSEKSQYKPVVVWFRWTPKTYAVIIIIILFGRHLFYGLLSCAITLHTGPG